MLHLNSGRRFYFDVDTTLTVTMSTPFVYIYHHHHVKQLARISLTLSRHFSLSFIASARSSGLHPVSSHSCCMYVRAGRPAFARPYVGVHRSTSLMSSSLLFQQCPLCVCVCVWMGMSNFTRQMSAMAMPTMAEAITTSQLEYKELLEPA